MKKALYIIAIACTVFLACTKEEVQKPVLQYKVWVKNRSLKDVYIYRQISCKDTVYWKYSGEVESGNPDITYKFTFSSRNTDSPSVFKPKEFEVTGFRIVWMDCKPDTIAEIKYHELSDKRIYDIEVELNGKAYLNDSLIMN